MENSQIKDDKILSDLERIYDTQSYEEFFEVCCRFVIHIYLKNELMVDDVDACFMADDMLENFIMDLGKWCGKREADKSSERIGVDELYSSLSGFSSVVERINCNRIAFRQLSEIKEVLVLMMRGEKKRGKKEKVDLKRFISRCMRIEEPKNSYENEWEDFATILPEPVFYENMLPYFIYYVHYKNAIAVNNSEVRKRIKREIDGRRDVTTVDRCVSCEEVIYVLKVMEQLFYEKDAEKVSEGYEIKLGSIYNFLKDMQFYKTEILLKQKKYIRDMLHDDFIPAGKAASALLEFMDHVEKSGVDQEINLNRRVLKSFTKRKKWEKIEIDGEIIQGYRYLNDDETGDYRTVPRQIAKYFGKTWEGCTNECVYYMHVPLEDMIKRKLIKKKNDDAYTARENRRIAAYTKRNWLRFILFLELDLKKDAYMSLTIFKIADYLVWKRLEQYGKKHEYDELEVYIKGCYGVFYLLIEQVKSFLAKFEEMAEMVEKEFKKGIEECGCSDSEYADTLFEKVLLSELLGNYASLKWAELEN